MPGRIPGYMQPMPYRPAPPLAQPMAPPPPPARVSLVGQGPAGSYQGVQVRITPREKQIMDICNRSIEDTWRILDKGAGNLNHDILYSGAESSKRMYVARGELNRISTSSLNYQKTAAKFRAGGCLEFATINAALIAARLHEAGINEVVNVQETRGVNHFVATVGSASRPRRQLVSDAWPLFGRTDTMDNFGISNQLRSPRVTFQPGSVSTRDKNEILDAPVVSSNEINRRFKRDMEEAGVPIRSSEATNPVVIMDRLRGMPRYGNIQSSANINVEYHAIDSNGMHHGVVRHELDPELLARRQRRLAELTPEKLNLLNTVMSPRPGDLPPR